MYERAKYLKYKFIRNGVSGLIISALLINFTLTKGESAMPGLIIIPVATFAWLYLGFWINKNLKAKNNSKDSAEIKDERISFRQVEFTLTILLVAGIFLDIRHWPYANYLIIPVAIAYLYWLYSQIKLLNNYFKA